MDESGAEFPYAAPQRRRDPVWDYGSLAVFGGWWSLDRWINTFQNGADLSSLALTILMTAGVAFNGWRAIRGFAGIDARRARLGREVPGGSEPDTRSVRR